MKKNNGFLLQDALFALFVILICSCLLAQGISTLYFQKDLKINEKIEKKLEKISMSAAVRGRNLVAMTISSRLAKSRMALPKYCSLVPH